MKASNRGTAIAAPSVESVDDSAEAVIHPVPIRATWNNAGRVDYVSQDKPDGSIGWREEKPHDFDALPRADKVNSKLGRHDRAERIAEGMRKRTEPEVETEIEVDITDEETE